MISKIICTQDLPGEREWINSRYPGYKNLETEFSGHWPSEIPDSTVESVIWEIPPDSTINLSNLNNTKELSLFRPCNTFVDPRWCDTEYLLTDVKFLSNRPRSKYAQIITFARAGTRFLEQILYNHLEYTELSEHKFLGTTDINQEVHNLCAEHSPDVFLIYRPDWWEWATSNFIAIRNRYFDTSTNKMWSPHSISDINWESTQIFTVSNQELDQLPEAVKSNWNSFCHLRTQFPNLNFYVIDFFSLIQQSKYVNLDTKIKYNKTKLISNYQTLKYRFDLEHLDNLKKFEYNAVSHLKRMNCLSLESLLNI